MGRQVDDTRAWKARCAIGRVPLHGYWCSPCQHNIRCKLKRVTAQEALAVHPPASLTYGHVPMANRLLLLLCELPAAGAHNARFRSSQAMGTSFGPAASPLAAIAAAVSAGRAAARQARLLSSLEEQLGFVVRCVNDRRDHIPPVMSATAVTFPFDISFSG